MYLSAQIPITMLAEKAWLNMMMAMVCFRVVSSCLGASPSRTHTCPRAEQAPVRVHCETNHAHSCGDSAAGTYLAHQPAEGLVNEGERDRVHEDLAHYRLVQHHHADVHDVPACHVP